MKKKLIPILFFIILFFIICFNTIIAEQGWTAYGITESYKDSTLSATVSGIIDEILKHEGDFVKKGDVILKLENELETLEVKRRRLISESKLEVEAAKSQLETIKLDLEGTRHIYEKTQSISKDELQKKELEFKLAEAELARLTVKENLEKIEYQIAKAQLYRRIITAPFDGVIIKHYIEIGEICNPQIPLVRIADIRQCRLITQIEGSISSNIKKGTKVKITINEIDKPLVCQGTIEFISPVVDPSSGLREVKALFNNPDGKIKPGLTGSILLK